MSTKGRILFVNQEVYPYIDESHLSKMGKDLPQSMIDRGKDVRTFMPRFGHINERKNQLHEVIRLSGMNIVINNHDHQLIIKVASIQSTRMQVYFIDNEDYFARKAGVRDANDVFFEDNDERAIFFSRGVLETVKKLGWNPHIVHCTGWFAASMTPFYVKRAYRNQPAFEKAKVVITLYDDDFSEDLSPLLEKKLKADGATPKDLKIFKGPNYLGTMKAAISYSSGVVLGSPNINPELIEFAKEQKKPIVPYGENGLLYDEIDKLYDEIIETIDTED